MAGSETIKRIDGWAMECHLRRKTLMDKLRIMKDMRQYETKWRHVVREVEFDILVDKIVDLL